MKLALLQLQVEYSRPEANLERLRASFAQVADDCDFVLIPEAPFLGWISDSARLKAESMPGKITNTLQDLARRNHVNVVSGLTRKEGGKIFNSAVFIDRTGRVQLVYDKINELSIAVPPYTRGWKLAAVPTPDFGPVGVHICADVFVPELTGALALMGCRLILSPVAWACDAGKEAENLATLKRHYRARCTDYGLFIAAADSVGVVSEGVWKGKLLHGNSLVCSPEGEFILEGPTNEPAVLEVELEL